MECNKEEARRAIEMAERKLSENDFSGAKKFINKAHNLYPNLDGLKQGLMMVDVYISASNRGEEEEEADWYGILGVDPLADDEAVKKQYRKLALLLHPDKNKLNGAEGAFKLVTEAWCMLSDKVTRTSYDQRRKFEEAKTEMQKQPYPHQPASSGMQKPPNPCEPASYNGNHNARDRDAKTEMHKQPYPHRPASSGMQKPPNPCDPASNSGNENARDSTVDQSVGDLSNKIAGWIKERLNLLRQAASSDENQNARDGVDPSNGDRGNKLSRWIKKRLSSLKPASYNGNQNARDDGTFWTMCNRCKAQGKYMRDDCLDKAILCPHCDHPFIATEISPEASPQNTSSGTYFKRFSPSSVSFHLSCCKVQVL